MNKRSTNYTKWLAVVLAGAFVLRLVAAFWWETKVVERSQFAFGDSYSYWVLAEHIAHGKPYEYGAGQAKMFRAPGYPLLLSPLFVLSADPPVLSARILGCVFGTLAVGGVIWLARQLLSERASLVAGAMAAFYPGAVGMSVFVLSEAPFCPLMLGQLIAWAAALKRTCTRRTMLYALLAGFLGGTATLVRPSWLLFAPFACAIGITIAGDRRRHAMMTVAIAAGMVVAMLPWWVRNYNMTGRLILTTTQFGSSLYDGLNPHANGDSDMSFVNGFVEDQRDADLASADSLAGTFEERLDDRMRDAAVDWARQNPSRVLQLACVKLLRMWSPLPNAVQFQSWKFRLVIMLGYVPLIALAIGGAMRFVRSGWPFMLCVLPAVYFSCLHAVFVSSIRYRQPPMLALIVLAAGMAELMLVRWFDNEAAHGATVAD